MQTPQIIGVIGDALGCILYIAGIVAGIIMLLRKKILPGALATGGFLLLGLNLALNYIFSLVILPAIIKAGGQSNTYYWLTCLKMPVYLIGLAALVVLVFTLISKKADDSVTKTEDLPEVPQVP